MRIKNPNAAAASPVTAQDKTDLQGALAALPASSAPTFDEIRAQIPVARRARFTDGLLCQAALDLALTVTPG
jgi:hypothetical protein